MDLFYFPFHFACTISQGAFRVGFLTKSPKNVRNKLFVSRKWSIFARNLSFKKKEEKKSEEMLCNEKRSEHFRENSKILRKTISSKTKIHGGNHLLILQSHFPFSIRAWSIVTYITPCTRPNLKAFSHYVKYFKEKRKNKYCKKASKN